MQRSEQELPNCGPNRGGAVQKRDGWSVAALQAGARDAGLSPAAAGLVSAGPYGLVEVRAARGGEKGGGSWRT